MKKFVHIVLLTVALLEVSACTNHEVDKDLEIITPRDSIQGLPYEEETELQA